MQVDVGVDLVSVGRVAESLARFGGRFLRRLFTDSEIAYATATPELAAERLAARFAAKEAAIKALGLADQGIGWRQIEVERLASGQCRLVLHGDARVAADRAGVSALSVSLTHEGEYSAAVVLASRRSAPGVAAPVRRRGVVEGGSDPARRFPVGRNPRKQPQ